jgi:6-pyruvoyltetrahydropterin/6-carboxytetrahydropterin synthase
MLIFKSFTFDSAHALPNVPEGHKCRNVHGHTYHLTAYIEGGLEPHLEWVIDFADIKKIIVPIVKELDHKYLNDLPGLENPTCERIAIWIWDRIKKDIPNLKRVQLNETPTSGVIYEGQ